MTPDTAAFEEEAVFVECAEKTDVSTPPELRTDFRHLAMVDGTSGFDIDKYSWSGFQLLSTSEYRNNHYLKCTCTGTCTCKYCCRQSTYAG